MSARLQGNALLGHAARHALAVGILIAGADHPLVALAGALALQLAAFAYTHELAHGALGLPRRLNEVALSLAALPMLVSAHNMRLLHLRHHARPLGGDDVEGVGATVPFWRALLEGPMNAAQYRVEALRVATGRERSLIIGETLACVVLAAGALLSGSTIGAAWVVVNVVMQLTASVWASHLTHRPPPVLLSIAGWLRCVPSAMIASFLHHERHHRYPSIPCNQL
jgi:fatty acid desaturase